MRFESIAFAASLCSRKRCAVDGGANCGYVTDLLLQLGFERIIAVEPGPTFAELQARFCGASNVILVEAALGHIHDKFVWFGPTAPGKPAKLWYADADRAGSVRMVRFDDCFPNGQGIDLIKLDLETGELDALRGMSNTLSVNRPVVVCETADGFVQQKDGVGRPALFAYMDTMGYEVAGIFNVDTIWKPR